MRASHLASLGIGNVYSSMAGLEFLKLFVRLFLFNSSNNALTTLLSTPAVPQMECSRNPECVVGAFRSLSASRLSLMSWNSTNDLRDSAHDSSSSNIAEDIGKCVQSHALGIEMR